MLTSKDNNAANQSNDLAVITIAREDIVRFSRALAAYIPQEFLINKARPVVISVEGSIRSGKKIIADAGRDGLFLVEEPQFVKNASHRKGVRHAYALMAQSAVDGVSRVFNGFSSKPHDISVSGYKEYDEYAIKALQGQPVEVSFINLAWSEGYSFDDLVLDDKDLSFFDSHKAMRKHGGIIYAHNGGNFFRRLQTPDIEIWFETGQSKSYIASEGLRRLRFDKGQLQDCFAGRYAPDWLRYIEIRINNQALNDQGQITQRLKQDFGFAAISLPSHLSKEEMAFKRVQQIRDGHIPFIK